LLNDASTGASRTGAVSDAVAPATNSGYSV
jgi:hypothetical protein